MPLKNLASKAFPRRKSSGNVLEELDHPVEGFRVLSQVEVAERKHEKEKEKERVKSTGGLLSGVRAHKAHQKSFDDDYGTSNRGSNGSSGADSTASKTFDNSSARFSSSSTLPSSTDQDHEDLFAHHKHADNRTFSIRGAARTFTFGNRSQKAMSAALPRTDDDELFLPPPLGHKREQSLTTISSTSTALPPKVDTGLALGVSDFGSGFDDLFAGLDKRQSAVIPDVPKPPPVPGIIRSESEPMLAPPKAFATNRQLQTPDPIQIDKTRDIPASPYSWDSHNSHDGLMASPRSPDFIEKGPPVPPHRHMNNQSPAYQAVGSHLTAPSAVLHKPVPGTPSPKNSISSTVPSYKSLSRQNSAESPTKPLDIPPTAIFDREEPSIMANDGTPRPKMVEPTKRTSEMQSKRDSTSTAIASPSERPGAKKVMNQAQFNRYREDKEQADANGTASSDSESDVDYEDDEEERTKELQRQRRKQEGHLAVWRQQMHKVTGEKPLPTQRTSVDRPSSQFDPAAANAKNSDEDSADEDTPLGILLAHGFPTKARPPVKPTGPYASKLPIESHSTTDLRLSSDHRTFSAPNLRPGTSQGQRPSSIAGSVSGASGGDRRSVLPVFARNLPQDPYFGASLVVPANRESLAFGQSGPGSMYGGGTSTQNTTLINVIANEERAKAMRRGSPNAQAGFGPATQQPLLNMNNQSGSGMSPMHSMGPTAPPMNPMMPQMNPMNPMQMGSMHMGSQSADMSQAMAQLMLNQQILQQQLAQSQQLMMQMAQGQMPMSGGGMPQMPQMSQMPQMPQVPQMPGLSPFVTQNRPMSLYSNAGMQNQRTMSMIQPPQLPMLPSQQGRGYAPSIVNLNTRYAPSIAPSERSTVGMASRYRPVTHQPLDGTSSVSNSTLQPASALANSARLVDDSLAPNKGNKKNILAVLKRSNKENETVHEDDDEGWGDLNARKSKWGAKDNHDNNSSQGLRELYVDGI